MAQRVVVAISSGNHGRAVAHAAKCLGIKAVVWLSHLGPKNKAQAIRNTGADLRIA
jgi:threonine dehydratase